MGLRPQYCLDHAPLGRVLVCVNPQARRFIARVRDGSVVLTCPVGQEPAALHRALDAMAPSLLPALQAPRPDPFPEGFRFNGPDWEFRVCTDPHLRPGRVITKYDPAFPRFAVVRAPGVGDATVGRAVENLAYALTAKLVVPLVYEEARRLGLADRITGTRVYRGRTTLGTCSAGGRISLNARTAFLSHDLRRAIVTHELTHLTHFDHSPAFYALWESYYGAAVRPLRRALREMKYPLMPH